jgi:hypothetical protein
MSPRLTLDPSSFERLLAAALVIQHRNEQEARYRLLVPDKTPVDLGGKGVHSPEATAGAGKSLLASFARYRVKTWITFDSKLTLSPHRAVAKAMAPVSVLLIVVAFTLTQVWHRDHFHTVAAASTTNHLSEEAIKKAEQLRSISMDRVSHRQVTDRDVSSVVEALSKYEIPALRRQAQYGDDSAAFLIGMLYETGHFVPQSCVSAADWVMASANAGNAAAQYNLGLRYRDGDGVTANQDEAAKWLRKAADRQYSDATLALETLTSGDVRSTNSIPGTTDRFAAGSVSR